MENLKKKTIELEKKKFHYNSLQPMPEINQI